MKIYKLLLSPTTWTELFKITLKGSNDTQKVPIAYDFPNVELNKREKGLIA